MNLIAQGKTICHCESLYRNLIHLGKFTNLHKMVTRRVGLVDVVEQGFEELINHKDEHVKILISPKAETSSSGNHK